MNRRARIGAPIPCAPRQAARRRVNFGLGSRRERGNLRSVRQRIPPRRDGRSAGRGSSGALILILILLLLLILVLILLFILILLFFSRR